MTYQRDAIETECCMFLGAGEGNMYLSDDDPSSLAVDAEGQMARFVTKTLRVCSGIVVRTNVLYLGTEAVVAVTGEVNFYSQNKR